MALVAFSEASMRRDLGEVAALTQYVLSLAAPHPQRVFRGWRARARCKDLRGYFRFIALTAAALEIQRFVRASTARSIINAMRSGLQGGKVVVIQKVWRGALARMRLAKMREAKAAGVRLAASFSIQRVWRGYAALRHVREAVSAAAREDFRVAFAWAVVTTQRFVRGHQAKALVVQKKLELHLSDRLQRLAHKYLQSGNLWGFLKAVDDDYRRYEQSQGEILAREDELAATFVEKVVMARERQEQEGWDMYNKMSAQQRRGSASSAGQRPGTSASGSSTSVPGSRLRRVVESGLLMLEDAKMAEEARSASAGLKKAFPVYSKSLSAGRQRKVRTRLESTKSGEGGSGWESTDHHGEEFTPSAPLGRTPEIGSAGRKHPASMVRFAGSGPSSGAAAPSGGGVSAPTSARVEGGCRPGSVSTVAETVDGLRTPHLPPTHKKHDGNGSLPQPPAMPGLSIVKDLPGGLEDTVERLVRAAGLRVFVPDGMVPAGTPPALAFQQFRGLPADSLARVRWEVLLGEWCMPVVDKLRARGCLSIKDLLPMKRFVALAHQISMPQALSASCRGCIRELRSSGIKPIGRGVLHTKERFGHITDGVLTIGQISSTGGPSQFIGTRPLSSNARKLAVGQESRGETRSEGGLGGASGSDGGKGSNSTFPDDVAVFRLVASLREDVRSWGGLDDEFGLFLQRAAFYVVPHGADFSKDTAGNGAKSAATVIRPGTGPGAAGQGVGVRPAALVDFAREMVALGRGGLCDSGDETGQDAEDDDGSDDSGVDIARRQRTGRAKELLEERLQAALLFSAPFAMRFAAGGVKTTRDLLRCRLQDWGLRGAADGDSAFAGRDRQAQSEEGSVATSHSTRGGIGEYRFQIESMLRVLVANEMAHEGAGRLFASDGAAAAALNSKVSLSEALRGIVPSEKVRAAFC